MKQVAQTGCESLFLWRYSKAFWTLLSLFCHQVIISSSQWSTCSVSRYVWLLPLSYPDSELHALVCLAFLLLNPLFIQLWWHSLQRGSQEHRTCLSFFSNSSWLSWQWCLRPCTSSGPAAVLKSLELCAAPVVILSLMFFPCSSNGWWVLQLVSPWHRQDWVCSQRWKFICDTAVVDIISRSLCIQFYKAESRVLQLLLYMDI